jgi:hypothetical protein
MNSDGCIYVLMLHKIQATNAFCVCLVHHQYISKVVYHIFPNIKKLIKPTDEGMTNGPPIFAYLVFGSGRVSHERLSRPIKAVAWHGPGAILGAQARFRGVQVRLVLG